MKCSNLTQRFPMSCWNQEIKVKLTEHRAVQAWRVVCVITDERLVMRPSNVVDLLLKRSATCMELVHLNGQRSRSQDRHISVHLYLMSGIITQQINTVEVQISFAAARVGNAVLKIRSQRSRSSGAAIVKCEMRSKMLKEWLYNPQSWRIFWPKKVYMPKPTQLTL